MNNKSLLLIITAGVVLLVVVLAASGQASGQEWRLERSDTPGQVHFTVERWKPGSHWSSGHDVPRANFQGLSTGTLENGGPAKFEYVQDAGHLVCEGRFASGYGKGTFTFIPNPEFPAELKKLGYDPPDEEQQFSMALIGVSLEFARGVHDAALHATTRQLVDLRIHGVTLDYIRETARAGYRNLSAQEYIDLRIHGVDTEFIRYLKAAGYDLPASQLIELRIHGVDTAYVLDLKSYGLQPPAADLVQLRIHGVSPDYLKGLKDAGYGVLTVGEITDLRIHGVDTKFINESKSLGYNFTPRELTDLRIHGVDGAYLRRLRDSGLRNLNAAQIEKLRIHGVD